MGNVQSFNFKPIIPVKTSIDWYRSTVLTEKITCKFEISLVAAIKDEKNTVKVEYLIKENNLEAHLKKNINSYYLFDLNLISSISEYIAESDVVLHLEFDSRQIYMKSTDDIKYKNFKSKLQTIPIIYSTTTTTYSNINIYASPFKSKIAEFATFAPVERSILFSSWHSTLENDIKKATIFTDTCLFKLYIALDDPYTKHLDFYKINVERKIEYIQDNIMAKFYLENLKEFRLFLEKNYYSTFNKINFISSKFSLNFREEEDKLITNMINSITKKYDIKFDEGIDCDEQVLGKVIIIEASFNMTFAIIQEIEDYYGNNIQVSYLNSEVKKLFK